MTTKFTPGTWEIKHREEEGVIEIGMASYLRDPGCYDPVHHLDLYDCLYPEDGDQFQEAMANARLIAAATELYEALSLIVSAVKLSGHCYLRPDDSRFEKALTALSKAVEP